MRRARDPQHPLRQKRDPYDHEANYRKPIARSDAIRLFVKAVLVVGAGVWFKFASDDRIHEGAKLALATGVALMGAGLTDLLYLRTSEIEQMFLNTLRRQVVGRWALVALGFSLVIGALVAYAR